MRRVLFLRFLGGIVWMFNYIGVPRKCLYMDFVWNDTASKVHFASNCTIGTAVIYAKCYHHHDMI